MNRINLCNRTLISLLSFLWLTSIYASLPVWTFTPLTSTHVAVAPTQTATIQYRVTNQSKKIHSLVMLPMIGISQDMTGPGNCTSPFILNYQQSCVLSLQVNGSALTGDIFGGPVVCQQGNLLECYQPSLFDALAVQKISDPSSIQQYTVVPSADANGSISPITSQEVNAGTTLTFTATPNTGYGVSQWFVDGTLAQTGGTLFQLTNITANHAVKVTFGTVTLSPSLSSIALSINCHQAPCTTTQNPALTGNPRLITIQNNGSVGATNVLVNASGLPSGTHLSSNTCTGTLNAGSSCTVTITPGSVANADSNNIACTSGTQPLASTITITADGGLSTQVQAYVLGYGCQYEGGFIYSVDDTTPLSISIGGKVVSLVDQTTGIIWSSNGNGPASGDVDYTTILGIDETSTTSTPSPTSPAYPVGTPAYTPCNGASDGACDSSNIVSYYNFNRTSGGSAPTPVTDYAAGLCTTIINTYSDWYLPAICEMDAVHTGLACSSGTQSMWGSLSFLIGDSSTCTPPSGTNCLSGNYWSSTETAFSPQQLVWNESFSASGQSPGNKNNQFGVRCSRGF